MNATWLDHSPAGVVVGCRRCPSWREHRATTTAAWAAGLDHAKAVHGGDSPEARHARKNLSARNAGTVAGEG